MAAINRRGYAKTGCRRNNPYCSAHPLDGLAGLPAAAAAVAPVVVAVVLVAVLHQSDQACLH